MNGKTGISRVDRGSERLIVSDHTRTLVPVETWLYSSPELRSSGKSVDVGLFSEALLYYDRVLLNVSTPFQLAELIRWFIDRRQYGKLIRLFYDGDLQLFDYSFITGPIERNGVYSIWNMEDQVQAIDGTFAQRFLDHPEVDGLFASKADKKELRRALGKYCIEAKAVDFGPAIENAKADTHNPQRFALILQAAVDELYRTNAPDKVVPRVQATIDETDPKTHRIVWNVDLDALSRQLGPKLGFHVGMPLTAAAICNRLLWTSAQMSCDLYLARPMSSLVGDKLQESASRSAKPQGLIQQLQAEVEFPNVKALITGDKLDFSELLRIRHKAKKFRQWLQSEAERDRNAIIAYHNEVAKELGIVTVARTALEIFGVLGLTGLSPYLAQQLEPAVPAVLANSVGAVVGTAGAMLVEFSARLHNNWKPVVFGNWMMDHIANYLRSAETAKRFD